MQGFLFSDHQADLNGMRLRLEAAFGKIRDEMRLDPTSQFVHALIGSRTYDEISAQAFVRLTTRYRNWDSIADARVDDVQGVLADVTYAETKAVSLGRALRKIRASAGSIDLTFLADLSVVAGHAWLENIYGVGRKIAAVTLNFSALRKRTFVVDTHVLRVMQRYGFVGARADAVAVYNVVMNSAEHLDADDLYELHWQLKYLGQKFCTHSVALCGRCPLSGICLKRVENAARPSKWLWAIRQ